MAAVGDFDEERSGANMNQHASSGSIREASFVALMKGSEDENNTTVQDVLRMVKTVKHFRPSQDVFDTFLNRLLV